MFIVPVGVTVLVTQVGKDWYGENLEVKVTRKESVYELEDVVADPMGHTTRSHSLGVGQGDQDTPAEALPQVYARLGYYGFQLKHNQRGYDVMLVSGNKVKVI